MRANVLGFAEIMCQKVQMYSAIRRRTRDGAVNFLHV